MIQVSVIILTYNSDPQQLRQTLRAAAAQTGLQLEILISDDGSAQKDFSFLPGFMESLQVENWKLLDNRENKGTVQNCLTAIGQAQGEYVFLSSPGDFLFDDHVLQDFYRFCKTHNADCCFGNVLCYSQKQDAPYLTRPDCVPPRPFLYAPDACPTAGKLSFLSDAWVIGASYFRRRDFALQYLGRCAETARYTEDTCSTVFALADGHRLYHYNRNMLWYEDGTGISTGINPRWQALLTADLQNTAAALKAAYPRDPYVDLFYIKAMTDGRRKWLLPALLRHPVLFIRRAVYRLYPKSPVHCREEDLVRLSRLLHTK